MTLMVVSSQSSTFPSIEEMHHGEGPSQKAILPLTPLLTPFLGYSAWPTPHRPHADTGKAS